MLQIIPTDFYSKHVTQLIDSTMTKIISLMRILFKIRTFLSDLKWKFLILDLNRLMNFSGLKKI